MLARRYVRSKCVRLQQNGVLTLIQTAAWKSGHGVGSRVFLIEVEQRGRGFADLNSVPDHCQIASTCRIGMVQPKGLETPPNA